MLVQIYLELDLKGELGDVLQTKARQMLQALGRDWKKHICSVDGEEKLLACFDMFLHSSKMYLLSDRLEKHLASNEVACLVALQIKAVQIHLAA